MRIRSTIVEGTAFTKMLSRALSRNQIHSVQILLDIWIALFARPSRLQARSTSVHREACYGPDLMTVFGCPHLRNRDSGFYGGHGIQFVNTLQLSESREFIISTNHKNPPRSIATHDNQQNCETTTRANIRLVVVILKDFDCETFKRLTTAI